jgi:Flp pilus assembly protein TadD
MRGLRWLLLAPLLLTLTPALAAQQWFAVKSDHLVSYSSGDDHKAREAALRGEQLIAVFSEIFHRGQIHFSTPIYVLASHSSEVANYDAILVHTPPANYIVADPTQPERWSKAAHAIAALTLEDNYPRAQPWFDSGIASYLAGTRFSGEQMELGAPPPGLMLPGPSDWIPLETLFAIKESQQLSPAQRTGFEGESWAVVAWLIGNSRLAQAGTYFDAVQSRGIAPQQAVSDAFSMSFGDFDREVRESLGKIAVRKMAAPRAEESRLQSKKLSAADGHVLLANLTLFGEDGERTLHELAAYMRENQENAAVHRALAWAFLRRHDMDHAIEHIRRALELEDTDPAMHYLYALWLNQGAEDSIRIESAQARMGTELKAALQRDPSYSFALELLGLAELSDGEAKTALPALQQASMLRPRSDRYYLNLARAYEAAGNLDAARRLMLYARTGNDAAVSAEAAQSLSELGRQKKQRQVWAEMGVTSSAAPTKPGKYDNLQEAIEEDEQAEAKRRTAEKAGDTRKMEFMKGRIVSVACETGPGATIVVSSGGVTWKMQVADRNTVVLIGVERFDCAWHDVAVSLNYKRRDAHEGNLVSLELK